MIIERGQLRAVLRRAESTGCDFADYPPLVRALLLYIRASK